MKVEEDIHEVIARHMRGLADQIQNDFWRDGFVDVELIAIIIREFAKKVEEL